MYAVIEYTPGYLPENDDPPVFETWEEAVNYVLGYRESLYEEEFAHDEDGNLVLDIGPFETDGFYYEDKRKIHDLGRIVEIVEIEDEDEA